MSQTAVLVWLSASSLLPTFRAELNAFAHSRLLRLEAPQENSAGFRTAVYAPDAVARIESSLEEARNAIASLEPSRALAALERADQLLRERPELPQSAWLMAEILEWSAEVESSAPDGAEAANVLRSRAQALEGPRAVPFTDRAPVTGGVALTPRSIEVAGLEPGDRLEWDGRATATTLESAAGEHHARVSRDGRLLWAGWVKLSATDSRVRLPVPETAACSPDDIGQGQIVGGRARPALQARCSSYVLARVHPSGGIEAAWCERQSCGPVQVWQRGAQLHAASEQRAPLWLYAASASAAALVVTGLVLWRSGAFDRPEARTTEGWVFEGQKPMALRF